MIYILLTLYLLGVFITPIIYLNMSFSLKYTPITSFFGLIIRSVFWPLAIIERIFFY